MIKNIVFDLGNVIVDLHYEASFEQFGVDTGRFEEIYQTELFRNFERGTIDEEGFFDYFCESTSFRREDINALKSVMHTCFPLRKKVWDLVNDLGRSYRVFLLSNTNTLDFGSIENRLDIRKPFEKVYLSYEQGHRKPDIETYRHAEKILDIRPEETLFLDDRPENTAAADECGWNTVRVLNEDHIFNALEEWNILPVPTEKAGG